MNKFIRVLLTISILSISACSSSGNQSLKNETQATLQTKLIKNKTSKSDVVRAFGSPTSVTSKNDGGDIYLYEMNNGKINPLTYVPVVGFFAGNTTTESRTLSITFNKNDTVNTWSFSSEDRKSENGIAN
jgi:outer membrane protein assembly factor BamE (lipoprotein component of BamABCDE complex)